MNNSHFFILFLSLISLAANSAIRELETTRLQSTAGAGVASVLVNEASFLNPASIVFVPTSAFYYQQGSSKLNNDSDQRSTEFSDGSNEIYLLSDSSGQLKGTFSYQRQAENQYKRLRFTSSLAASYGKRSSLGLLYRYTTDEDIRENEEKKYHQVVLGFMHIFSEELSIGATLVDPFLSNKEDAKATIGIQYNLISNLIFVLDYGVNFNDDPNKNSVTKGALQINFFKDLFLRGGRFHDNITGLSGNAWGISWIGPRLAFEYAVKSSEVTQEKTNYLYEDEKIVESSLSVAIIF
jgi:hypothetical protein